MATAMESTEQGLTREQIADEIVAGFRERGMGVYVSHLLDRYSFGSPDADRRSSILHMMDIPTDEFRGMHGRVTGEHSGVGFDMVEVLLHLPDAFPKQAAVSEAKRRIRDREEQARRDRDHAELMSTRYPQLVAEQSGKLNAGLRTELDGLIAKLVTTRDSAISLRISQIASKLDISKNAIVSRIEFVERVADQTAKIDDLLASNERPTSNGGCLLGGWVSLVQSWRDDRPGYFQDTPQAVTTAFGETVELWRLHGATQE